MDVFSQLTWTIFPILSKWPIFPNGRCFIVDHYTVDLFSISGLFSVDVFFRGPYFLNSRDQPRGTAYRVDPQNIVPGSLLATIENIQTDGRAIAYSALSVCCRALKLLYLEITKRRTFVIGASVISSVELRMRTERRRSQRRRSQ